MDKCYELKLSEKTFLNIKKNDFEDLGTIFEFEIKYKNNNFIILSFYNEKLRLLDQSQLLLLSEQPTYFNDNYLLIFTNFAKLNSNTSSIYNIFNYRTRSIFII